MAEAALWSSVGVGALSYLRKRGFADKTIRAVRLGYIPEELREAPEMWGLPAEHKPIWTPRGIAIPWRAAGSIWRLNIRRPSGKPKYIGPAGSANGLYGADGLYPGRPAVIVEGEFDAMAVAQEAGDLVAAVATGSTCGARHSRWVRLLAAAPWVLVAYDNDDAGQRAADWWFKSLPRARCLVPESDPADMLQTGRDVRAWVAELGVNISGECGSEAG
jgi:DNA primase